MLKILSYLKPKARPEIIDARRIYQRTMQQSRNRAFFGADKFSDTYDGRMETLCLHLSVILHALRQFDVQGQRLSQAIYDEMVADFDIALREEGLSDTGVSRRIKPLAKMFFERVKAYGDILSQDNSEDFNQEISLQKILVRYLALTHSADIDETISVVKEASVNFSIYVCALSLELSGKTLGQIASTDFQYPTIK